MLLSSQQVSGQIAVWPGRCGLGHPWEEMKEGLWVERSQPEREPRSPAVKAFDGFAKKWPWAEVAFPVLLTLPAPNGKWGLL